MRWRHGSGGGAARVPITVSTVAGQVAELVNVCIEGHGPYPFVIDSGAGESIIDVGLASQLHLSTPRIARASSTAWAVPGTRSRSGVPSWSVAGVALAPQSVTAATLPDFGRPGQPVGLLGSDVLSRFGAVRIDFTAQTLTLRGPAGTGPSNGARSGRTGRRARPPPPSLTQGETGTTVPLTVVLTPGDVSLNVRSAVRSRAVRTLHRRHRLLPVRRGQRRWPRVRIWPHSDLAQRQTTVCSTITVPLVHSGPWSVPGVALHPQLLGAADFGSIGARRDGRPARLRPVATLRLGDLRLQRGTVGPRVLSAMPGASPGGSAERGEMTDRMPGDHRVEDAEMDHPVAVAVGGQVGDELRSRSTPPVRAGDWRRPPAAAPLLAGGEKEPGRMRAALDASGPGQVNAGRRAATASP